MAGSTNPFPHLAFQTVLADRARLPRGGKTGQRARENKGDRPQHASRLRAAAGALAQRWRVEAERRAAVGLPGLPPDRPLVLLVEEDDAIEFLRSAFGFEIIAEEDDGIVLAATRDTDFDKLEQALAKFLAGQRGEGSAAKLYEILDVETSEQRLRRVLSSALRDAWPKIADETELTVDVSVSCVGEAKLPPFPAQSPKEDGAEFAARTARYLERYRDVMEQLGEIQMRREVDIKQFVEGYGGSVLRMTSQDPGDSTFHLPDSFTVRAQVSGKCFKDLAQNHPHVFQIGEVEEIEGIGTQPASQGAQGRPEIMPPPDDAPSVCVIDSGIQEDHVYLRPAVIAQESRCFGVPGASSTDTADYVAPHGHGTRVAGATLYPRHLPAAGTRTELPCWIHNARVLDGQCQVPRNVMPALYMERVVEHFHDPSRERPARLLNHSVNSVIPGRQVHMSTWGAAIDKMSYAHDVLIIQSAGNIPSRAVAAHLSAGMNYPQYQLDPSSGIRNPGQSLNALTVGSIAHVTYQQGQRSSVAQADHASAFSPAGEGIWGSIKPDVVEYGGDYVVDPGPPPMVFPASAVAQEMVRSTLHGLGATSMDDVGTSFAAPKVSHHAAVLARTLPDEPCLLYRALIANSARWPAWADTDPDPASVLRRIGYGIPDLGRATTNTEYCVTLITSGVQRIAAREAHIFRVPIPDELRLPGDDYLVRVDVTLSYASMPRRTRRRTKGYLATWLDWDVSKLGESEASFRNRIFNDGDEGHTDGAGVLDWMLRDRANHGHIQGLSRQNSTLQKDWCLVHSHQLPADFCIAVVGHPGWDPSPESKAKYALVVSFEAVNGDLRVYHPIRLAVEAQVPVEVRQRIQVPATSESG